MIKRAFFPAVGVFLLLACEEQLPAYEDPRNVFSVTIHADYMYRIGDNSVHFYLTFVNKYDETLADTARMDGSLTVTLARDPSFVRTFTLTPAQLYFARSYDSGTRELRVDPGDSIVFRVRYDFIDDQGRMLLNEGLKMNEDKDCGLRMVSDRELFVVKGGAIIFSRTLRSDSETLGYPICIVNPFISNKVCEDVNGPLDMCQ